MNKKLIIQIIVIVAAFGGAGLVLYNGLSNNSSSSVPQSSNTPTAKNPKDILPYGDSLDFSVLKSRPFVFDQLQVPQLNPKSDVGVSPEQLFNSLSVSNPSTKQ
jgi:Flp pilus assembly protein CpaB